MHFFCVCPARVYSLASVLEEQSAKYQACLENCISRRGLFAKSECIKGKLCPAFRCYKGRFTFLQYDRDDSARVKLPVAPSHHHRHCGITWILHTAGEHLCILFISYVLFNTLLKQLRSVSLFQDTLTLNIYSISRKTQKFTTTHYLHRQ